MRADVKILASAGGPQEHFKRGKEGSGPNNRCKHRKWTNAKKVECDLAANIVFDE